MPELTVEAIAKTGLEPTLVSADVSGDFFNNDGQTFLFVENGATDVVVTVTAQNTSASKPGFGDLTFTDNVTTVTASTQEFIGPFEPSIFNDGNGDVQVTYDDISNVTLGAIRLPRRI